jgi:acetate kinase
MAIVVVNAGSSSVKFTCFGDSSRDVLAEGLVERVGQPGSLLHFKLNDEAEVLQRVKIADTRQAVEALAQCLYDPQMGVLRSPAEIMAVGHRVVHGGEKLSRSQVIDAQVKSSIREYFDLAPLHNPPNLEGIEAAEDAFPKARQVGIFDTAFHSTIQPKAFLYALPYEFYQNHKIRRYGFHGISHGYVSRAAAGFMARPAEELNLITCHLGNGCSITAVKGGQSVDTSMGFTPLEGLVMGTRSGDLDPAIVIYLMERKGMSLSEVNQLLNKKSGLLGLSNDIGSDMRDLTHAMEQGDERAKTAIQVFCYRIRKYIGAFMAAMGGVDGIVFTGGIGENSALVRQMSLSGLDRLGICLDDELNNAPERAARYIQKADSPVNVLVVPTNEEKEIADQVWSVLGEGG